MTRRCRGTEGWQSLTDSLGLAAAEAALFAGIMEGRAYFNIHSSVFPGGEIAVSSSLFPNQARCWWSAQVSLDSH